MKNKKKSLFIIVLFIMSMLMIPNSIFTTEFVFATSSTSANSTLIHPMSVDTSTYSFVRLSATKAQATVKGYSSGVTPFIKLKITLQSAPLNSSTYTNVSSVNSIEYEVYDVNFISKTSSFPVTADKNYRIKIEITDKVNGNQTTQTYYCKLS
ncbi:hypothetical protein [Clostridium aminobutyricum]|uniref:Uncharacterized protein n=1 Tax=Clostridium aminobutyricum TaxID=33953 RepID=A0A939D689_CLOAM|nr:hypothetical protein [Clostridium aminobutyricum]MBN7771977.1 hypothetical protein [Clostridium aminobutyricum]